MKVAVLDNLRSVYNVGSIFRTANACGIEKIYLCGTTPTPLDKKGLPRSDFKKVALGAEETIAWEYKEDTVTLVQELKNKNYYSIAFEQDVLAVDYKEVRVEGKNDIAFIVGPEVTGMSKMVLQECSVIAEIPMLGTKESLNVTIAFGIGVYHILGL
jgi:23S rRNA (guanosine2251-2'-O)-methyltransferase